jgi:hypothetical protein
VNPAAVQALLAPDTVIPPRSGTVRHGAGVGVGAGVGFGVGTGVGAGVTRGVATAVAVGAAVACGAAVSLPGAGVGFDRPAPPGLPVDPAEGPPLGEPDAPALALGSPMPATDDPEPPDDPPATMLGRGVARPSAPPTDPSHPIVDNDTIETTAISATSIAAARRSSLRRRRRGLAAATVPVAAPHTSYGAAHIGHRPRALSQHQRHA